MLISSERQRALQEQDVNRDTIVQTFQEFTRCTDFSEELPVPLSVPIINRNLFFIYKTEDPSKYQQRHTFQVVTTELVNEDSAEVAAYRSYWFQDEGDAIVVLSSMRTMRNYQSRGFGSGLILLSNDVINDALQRFPQLSNGRVIARIGDTAKGDPIPQAERFFYPARDGWTSFYARQLGYHRTIPFKNTWEKVYR